MLKQARIMPSESIAALRPPPSCSSSLPKEKPRRLVVIEPEDSMVNSICHCDTKAADICCRDDDSKVIHNEIVPYSTVAHTLSNNNKKGRRQRQQRRHRQTLSSFSLTEQIMNDDTKDSATCSKPDGTVISDVSSDEGGDDGSYCDDLSHDTFEDGSTSAGKTPAKRDAPDESECSRSGGGGGGRASFGSEREAENSGRRKKRSLSITNYDPIPSAKKSHLRPVISKVETDSQQIAKRWKSGIYYNDVEISPGDSLMLGNPLVVTANKEQKSSHNSNNNCKAPSNNDGPTSVVSLDTTNSITNNSVPVRPLKAAPPLWTPNSSKSGILPPQNSYHYFDPYSTLSMESNKNNIVGMDYYYGNKITVMCCPPVLPRAIPGVTDTSLAPHWDKKQEIDHFIHKPPTNTSSLSRKEQRKGRQEGGNLSSRDSRQHSSFSSLSSTMKGIQFAGRPCPEAEVLDAALTLSACLPTAAAAASNASSTPPKEASPSHSMRMPPPPPLRPMPPPPRMLSR